MPLYGVCFILRQSTSKDGQSASSDVFMGWTRVPTHAHAHFLPAIVVFTHLNYTISYDGFGRGNVLQTCGNAACLFCDYLYL